ncbi:MlaD family protein [Desulfobacca acetoxidans]
MARKTSSFLVGLFVIIGVALTVIAIIWVGVTGYFQQGATYVTYVDESVQGLQKDSVVKFRGVDVGRVEHIRIAPDNKLVAIIMKINLPGDLTENIVAQLTSSGITGIMFIDLDYRRPGAPDLSPKIDFPSEYPIIPSKPSEYTRIISGINDVISRLNQIDIEGISTQLKDAIREITLLLKGDKVQSILAKTEKTAANLESLTGKANTLAGEVKLTEVIRETTATISEARKFVVELNRQLYDLKLPETMGKTRNLLREAQAIGENLHRTTESLEMFADRIYERPPDLLFGKPPTPRWNEKTAR